MSAARLRGAGREAADLDQQQRQPQLAAGEAVAVQVARRRAARAYFCSMSEKSSGGGGSLSSSSVPGLSCRTPSAAGPRCARGSSRRSSSVEQRGGVRLDEGALGLRSRCARRSPGRAGSARTRAARSSRNRSPAGEAGRARPTSTTTPRYCSPAMRWRSSSMATTLGASRGSSSSMSLRRLPVERARSARRPGSPAAPPAPTAAVPWRSVHETKRRVSGSGSEWLRRAARGGDDIAGGCARHR